MRWAVVALTGLAAALHLRALGAEEPWFDETFSIVVSSGSLGDLWHLSIADQVHPPGFALLLWGWIRLGGLDLAWLRLLPALAATLTVPVVVEAAHAARLSRRAGLTAGALAAVSPLLLAMSRELRMYAPLVLVTTLTLLAVLHRRSWGTAVGYLTLVSLHYFGALATAALVAGGVARDPRRWRRLVGESLPAALLLGGWLALVVRRATGPAFARGGWIPPLDPRGVLELPAQLVGTFGGDAGALPIALACLLVVAIGLRSATRTATAPAGETGRWPVLALAVLPPLSVALIDGIGGPHLWVIRYLIIVAPAWWVLLASAVDRVPARASGVVAVVMVAWATIAGLHAEAARPRKTTWSAVARALTGGRERVLCAQEEYVALPLRYQAMGHRLPLRIIGLRDCDAAHRPDGVLIRPGTEGGLRVPMGHGAMLGAPVDLGTTRPETRLVPLRW